MYFWVFIGITIDIARLSLIVLGLRRPQQVSRLKWWVLFFGIANVLVFLSLSLAVDYVLYYNILSWDSDSFLVLLRFSWYGMHLFVILGYLLLYFQIRNYYREIIARHGVHVTQQDKDQISLDLRSLIVLFASFSVYAIACIFFELWAVNLLT